MSLTAFDLSAGVFVRGLTNLKMQLAKAKEHAATTGGEAALLAARLASEKPAASDDARDLHKYTLSAHVHWAAEGAKLAIAQLLGAPAIPAANEAKSFADLDQRLDATIAHFQKLSPDELEAGLNRTITVTHRLGSTSASGSRFLVAFAIPHFYYHVTTAYGILRNQGVQLTMGDFLGNWGG